MRIFFKFPPNSRHLSITDKLFKTRRCPLFRGFTVLTLSNFIFNCKNYLQIKGCAMGTICAPSYANIFMDHFERKFIYPFIKRFSLIYLTFIDDIFFIWTGSKTDLENFSNQLNTKHPSIKFECEISKERISFLDTVIYIKNYKLHAKIFRKKTERQTFLNIN